MFAQDWDEFPENDDHLPLEERGWHKRLMERQGAINRLNRRLGRAIAQMSRAFASEQQDMAIQMLMKG